MQVLLDLFGEGKDLNILQMSLRSFIIFLYTLFLIRLSGRRSFGFNAPLDLIVTILLGAILSRAVVGASPFLPTLGSGFIISALHRLFAFLAVKHHTFGKITKGIKKPLYENGYFMRKNMTRFLVSEEDIREALRLNLGNESLNDIKTIYIERNGKISIIKNNIN